MNDTTSKLSGIFDTNGGKNRCQEGVVCDGVYRQCTLKAAHDGWPHITDLDGPQVQWRQLHK